MTFSPGTTGGKIKAAFTSFDIEEEASCSYDWLKVFDGVSNTGALIGTYCGSSIPGPFTSTTGSLTFQFSSDYSDNFSGWVADISCAGGPLTLIANAFPPDVCAGGSSQLVAIPSGGNENYTYLWSPSTYLDNPTSRTPISTPAENIAYTVTVNDGTSSLTSSPITLVVHSLPATPAITEDGGTLYSNASTGNQWYINGAMIPGANQPTYIPTTFGAYFVIVTDPVSHCQSLPSNMITFVMTGIDSHSAEHFVSVYPNPFHETLTVAYELPENGRVKISLFDVFGKEIRVLADVVSTAAGKYSFILSGKELTPGMYFLTLHKNSYQVVKKVFLTK